MDQRQNVRLFLEKHFPLNTEGIDELLVSFQVVKYTKNTIILNNGQHENKIRFLNKGNVREFYSNDTKENNINFYVKPSFISDLSSFINQTSTYKNQETLTEVEIFELSKNNFYQLLNKCTCGRSIVDVAFQKLLKAKEEFEYNRITKEPIELYQELVKYKPNWIQLLPQYHIASYLGITPETLSRIRSRLS